MDASRSLRSRPRISGEGFARHNVTCPRQRGLRKGGWKRRQVGHAPPKLECDRGGLIDYYINSLLIAKEKKRSSWCSTSSLRLRTLPTLFRGVLQLPARTKRRRPGSNSRKMGGEGGHKKRRLASAVQLYKHHPSEKYKVRDLEEIECEIDFISSQRPPSTEPRSSRKRARGSGSEAPGPAAASAAASANTPGRAAAAA